MQRSNHYDKNVATLKALQDAGADPNQAHCIEHHLYCDSERSFDLVMSLGRKRGFDVAHAGRHADDEALWSLDLTVRSLPSLEAIERQSIAIQEIADAAGADYDGWGTEVEIRDESAIHEWPFFDAENTAVITTRQVLEEGAPILRVSRDADDGAWQFHAGVPPQLEDARVIGLREVVDLDPSVRELADLPPGWVAARPAKTSPWERIHGRVLKAVAYLKPEIAEGDGAPARTLADEDAPILRAFAPGLLTAYLVDEDDHFSYVQGRDLREARVPEAELHRLALANLAGLAAAKVTIREAGPVKCLLLDGNFEASLILVDELWDGVLHSHAPDPVVAIPVRDVLAFCDIESAAGLLELRAVIGRVWPSGDHRLSKNLYRRVDGQWHIHG